MPKLFVGNLPFQATEDELRGWVESHGLQVDELKVMTDRDTGKPRGFGFVTIQDDVHKAVAALNGQECMGRALTVNEAKPMERREGGGGGRGSDCGSRREPRW